MYKDLKIENLLMMDKKCDFEFKIANFRVASKYVEEVLTLWCGSFGYIVPVILKNWPYGFKKNIVSIGIILYIILLEHSPFNGKQP